MEKVTNNILDPTSKFHLSKMLIIECKYIYQYINAISDFLEQCKYALRRACMHNQTFDKRITFIYTIYTLQIIWIGVVQKYYVLEFQRLL